MLVKLLFPTTLLLCTSITAVAEPDSRFDDSRQPRPNLVYSHAGEMDTDGILSPGELRVSFERIPRGAKAETTKQDLSREIP